jgi:hypothetical protein
LDLADAGRKSNCQKNPRGVASDKIEAPVRLQRFSYFSSLEIRRAQGLTDLLFLFMTICADFLDFPADKVAASEAWAVLKAALLLRKFQCLVDLLPLKSAGPSVSIYRV